MPILFRKESEIGINLCQDYSLETQTKLFSNRGKGLWLLEEVSSNYLHSKNKDSVWLEFSKDDPPQGNLSTRIP